MTTFEGIVLIADELPERAGDDVALDGLRHVAALEGLTLDESTIRFVSAEPATVEGVTARAARYLADAS